MAFEYFGDGGNAPNLYSTLSTVGQNSVYQLDTNPLIARLSTSQDIGVASSNTSSMVPHLAIYETEPVESLLDIYWETATVGLIADLNAAVATDFDGVVGFGSYTWTQPESIASGATFLSSVQPVDGNGAQVNNTTLTNYTTTNAAIQPVNTTATTNGYSFKITSPFVYDNNSAVDDNFTLTMNITNSSGVTSGTLQLTGSLSNSQPTINNVTGGQLTVINNNTGASGVIVTYTGVNGSSDATRNTEQLQWSITGGNSAGRFSIDANTGALTQTSANAGTYNLTIRATDSNNGVGALYIEANQKVVVSSTQVGYLIFMSDMGVFNAVCPMNGQPSNTCGQSVYYNQTTLNGSVNAGDVIRTGPNGTSSPLAAAGYYGLDCNSGAARMYIKISNSNGTVDAGYPASCG